MCCFSRLVRAVWNTNIFARASAGGRQLLAYAMSLTAAEQLAMVLPLPVPPGCPEDAVRFVDLEAYPDFFDDLDSGLFVVLEPPTRSFGAPHPPSKGRRLVVHDVGAFEASFVPTVADFARLDERFRLPREVWDDLPACRDRGQAEGARGRRLRVPAARPLAAHHGGTEGTERWRGEAAGPVLAWSERELHGDAGGTERERRETAHERRSGGAKGPAHRSDGRGSITGPARPKPKGTRSKACRPAGPRLLPVTGRLGTEGADYGAGWTVMVRAGSPMASGPKGKSMGSFSSHLATRLL